MLNTFDACVCSGSCFVFSHIAYNSPPVPRVIGVGPWPGCCGCGGRGGGGALIVCRILSASRDVALRTFVVVAVVVVVGGGVVVVVVVVV